MSLKDKLPKIGTIFLGVSLAASIMGFRINELRLGEKDFEKAEWIKYNNKSGRLWTPYVNEDAGHYRGSGNWDRYQYFVNQKNKGQLKGMMCLPDLDGDGKVGI